MNVDWFNDVLSEGAVAGAPSITPAALSFLDGEGRPIDAGTPLTEPPRLRSSYEAAAGERVSVTGSFDLGSDLDPQLRKYQDAGVGGFFDTSITYTDTFRSMARLLGSGFRAGGEVEDLQKRLAEMPAYPLDGYLQKENDVYIIKLG